MIPSVLTLPSPLMTLLWLHFNLRFEGKLLYYESGVKENIAYIKDLYKKNIIFDLLSQSWALKIIPTVSTWKILLWNAQAFIWQGRFKDFIVYVHKRKRSLDFLLQPSYNRARVVQSQNIYFSFKIHVIIQIWSVTQSVLKTSTVQGDLKNFNLTGHIKDRVSKLPQSCWFKWSP